MSTTMSRILKHHEFACAIPILLTLLSGCGRSWGSPELSSVTGVVTIEGQPIPEGQVTFIPDPTQGTRGPSFVGELRENGSFSIHGPNGVEGAIPGTYQVVIQSYGASSVDLIKHCQKRDCKPSDFKRSRLIPLVYETPSSTPLKVIVEAEKPNEYAFDLEHDQYSRRSRLRR